MSQFEQENDLGRGGGEVDEETQRLGWEQSLEDTPNRAPEQERPTDDPVPGPESVNQSQ